MLERRTDKSGKQRVRIERPGLQFRVELDPDEPRMIGPFDDFGQQAVGRHAREDKTLLLQRLDIGAIHLVAVTMPFGDAGRTAIDFRYMAVGRQLGLIGTKPHGSAKVPARFARLQALFAHPFGDDPHHRLVGFAEFGR